MRHKQAHAFPTSAAHSTNRVEGPAAGLRVWHGEIAWTGYSMGFDSYGFIVRAGRPCSKEVERRRASAGARSASRHFHGWHKRWVSHLFLQLILSSGAMVRKHDAKRHMTICALVGNRLWSPGIVRERRGSKSLFAWWKEFRHVG